MKAYLWLILSAAVMSAQQAPALIVANEPAGPALPPFRPLVVPARIGVMGKSSLSLAEVIGRVLDNDRDLAVSRIERQEAIFNVSGAQGYYDPRVGLNAHRLKSVTPVSSLIGGAANGKITQKELYADPQLSGVSPWLGGSYRLDFASARQSTDSTFVTLNPQFPTSVNLNLTQPLWRGLRYDDNRHRLQVARKNVQLTDQQFRQRVIEITTQAIQAYWELDFAYRNAGVQIEAVRLAEQQDQSNRRQVTQGLLARIDVVAAQTQVATFQQNVYTALENLTRAENALKALMAPNRNDAIWSTELIPTTEVDTHASKPVLSDAVAMAVKQRPEIAQSSISIDINRLDLRLIREQARPQIDAVATLTTQGLAGRPIPPGPNPFTGSTTAIINSLNTLLAQSGLPAVPPINTGSGTVPPIFVGGYGQSLDNLRSGGFSTASIGVQMSIPLRNRTAHAASAVSAAEGKRLQYLREQIEMAIEADVRNSLQALASAEARLDSAMLASQTADEQYESERRQFQAGTSSVFLVLQRQTDLIAARSREVRAKADVGRAAADVDRATAQTIEKQHIELGAASEIK